MKRNGKDNRAERKTYMYASKVFALFLPTPSGLHFESGLQGSFRGCKLNASQDMWELTRPHSSRGTRPSSQDMKKSVFLTVKMLKNSLEVFA